MGWRWGIRSIHPSPQIELSLINIKPIALCTSVILRVRGAEITRAETFFRQTSKAARLIKGDREPGFARSNLDFTLSPASLARSDLSTHVASCYNPFGI